MIVAAIFILVPFSLAFAALSDLISMKIPNRISIILLSSFLVLSPFIGMDLRTVSLCILAGLLVFMCCFAFFAFNLMGGGDVKLLTATSVWYGFNSSLIEFLLATTFIGGLLTLTILVLRAHSQEITSIGIPIPDSLTVAKKIPYGIGIAAAGLLTYGDSPVVNMAIASLN
ncbi:A24 family peptidase [Agrobacterium tumefaciens]|uniref:A24 family peptidase n=1 Tax=Agrobacterium tumefaciens TaxID=358 RepID=UPI001ADCBFDA|nr:prepilin peptidase [Agrobacterium tumefaciens]